MLTQAQINAENNTVALTDEQVMNLSLLVKKFPPYRDAPGLWPNLAVKLSQEQTGMTVKTKALKAVLTALGKLPTIVVESSGTSESTSHFSTVENWYDFAEIVLNVLYDIPVPFGRTTVSVVPAKITDLTLVERSVIRRSDTGRRY